MKNPMDLTGRTVLVTGASSGIGRATAILASEVGARVILAARNRERLEETRSKLVGEGHAIEEVDLFQTGEVARWLGGVIARHGPLAGLVHAAGVHRMLPLRVVTQKPMEEMWSGNVMSGFMLLKGLAAPKAAAEGCSVVLLSSSAAAVAAPGNSVYSATKGAVSAMTRSLALEVLPLKIRVNCIEAGLTETPMVDRTRDVMSPEQFDAMAATHPMGLGQPEDVANAAVFLLANSSRWMTGASLSVDGGFTAT